MDINGKVVNVKFADLHVIQNTVGRGVNVKFAELLVIQNTVGRGVNVKFAELLVMRNMIGPSFVGNVAYAERQDISYTLGMDVYVQLAA